ncbi:MAG: rhombosortase [Moraxellaceae bacterium]|nr:MAG: rhombosortase [Moraxellaceae bacterium]
MNNNDTSSTQDSHEFTASGYFAEWWFSFLVIAIVLTLSILGESATQALSLHRSMIDNGEWWRIITGQVVHLSVNHTLLNAMGYIILCFGFRKEVSATEEMLALIVSMFGVGFGIYLFNPEISWYVGLSGAIYGLLISNVMIGAKRTPTLSALFLFFIVTKIIYEQFFAGPDRATEALIGGEVAIDSHLYGALTGLIPGTFWVWRRHLRDSKHSPNKTA